MTNVKSISSLGKQGIMLDSLRQKIQRVRNDLETYKEYISHCQMRLIHEVQLRTETEATIQSLECQLNDAHQEVRKSNATISENKIYRKRLEELLQLQEGKMDLLQEELRKLCSQVKDADHNAQHSMNHVNKLTECLNQCEKQLEKSRVNNLKLEEELRAAAQNLHCVERAFERSSQKVVIADRKILQLQQRLQETEHRAYQAELNVEQLQHNSDNLEQDLEKRWHCALLKLTQHLQLPFNS